MPVQGEDIGYWMLAIGSDELRPVAGDRGHHTASRLPQSIVGDDLRSFVDIAEK
jgi:hypothetical protein